MSLIKPIKVLQLGSPSGLYGAERWILALIKYLDPQQVVSVVGVIKDDPYQDGKLCQEAEEQGFQSVQFQAYGRVNLSIIQQVRKYLVDEKIDILHTHFYKTDIIGTLATRGISCKIISTPHGWSKNIDIKLWCYEMLDRMFFPFMDAVVPLSEELCSPLNKFPILNRKLHLILNGVDLSEVSSSQLIHADILQSKKAGEFIIGYIGQLIPRKGIDVLISALKIVKNVKWKLFLVGEGDQRKELQLLSKNLGVDEHVKFVGFQKDRLDYLRGFDLFVLPSRLEGIPRCLMEAMVARVPVIASDIPGCNDLITHEENGLLFKLDDVKSLSSYIDKVAGSQALREQYARKALGVVTEKYSAKRMAEEYSSLFFQTLNVNCYARRKFI